MHIAIIGNGISGITAARFIRKLSDHKITVISKETDYFFSRTALMYIYMGHMKASHTQPYETGFWTKNRIDLVRAEVESIDFEQKKLRFVNRHFDGSELPKLDKPELAYDALILATGSIPNKFGWPGQDLEQVGQLYAMQDLEYLEECSSSIERAVIVGGGLIGIELAEMLHSRHKEATLLVREESYWNNVLPAEESRMVSDHILSHGIDLRLSTELKEIIGDQKGRVQKVITNKDEQIDCQYVGLTAGVRPNIDFLRPSGLNIERGIVVDKHLRTNMPDVYAIGDCAQISDPNEGRRGVEAIWYTGRMMGETVAYNICRDDRAYDPGIWFNSAKFMDIEYQVYGQMPAQVPEHIQSLLWLGDEKSVRINFDKSSRQVTGFNLMGIRFRHEVCEKWLRDGAKIEEVLGNLSYAFFDPELYANHYQEIIQAMQPQVGDFKRRETTVLDEVHAFLNN